MSLSHRILPTIAVCLALALVLSAGLSAQVLTTTFAGGNGQDGNMFDLKAPGTAVQITDFDINLATAATIEVYVVTGGGTYVGNETNAAAWTMVASVNVTGAGAGVPTNLNLPAVSGFSPILIAPGQTQGFYITTTGPTMTYTNGTAFGNLFASDSFLEFYEGTGNPYPFLTPIGAPRIWNGNIYYTPISGLTDDVGVLGVGQPNDSTGCSVLTNAETVEMSIANLGSNDVLAGTPVDFSFSVDGGTPTLETVLLPNTLTLGQSYTHTFAATADLSTPGARTVDVAVSYFADLDPSNDTAQKIVNNGNPNTVVSFPWVENFDASASNGTTVPPTGWEQDANDGGGTGADLDWYFRNTATTSTNTGPVGGADATSGSGYYAYVEDSSGNHPMINLISPCLDLGALASPQMQFQLHSFNNTVPTTTNENFLSVDIVTYPGATTTMDIVGPLGHDAMNVDYTSSTWRPQSVDLTPFTGQVVQLVFRGRSDGGSFTHDMAIDDVTVSSRWRLLVRLRSPARPSSTSMARSTATRRRFRAASEVPTSARSRRARLTR